VHKRSALTGAAMITLTAAAIAMAASGTASAAPAYQSTLRFTATYVTSSHQDAAPAGDSIGDRDVDQFSLTTPSGHNAGDASSDCVLIRADESIPLAQCAATLALADGTLVLGGVTTGTPTTTYAILGGTGRHIADKGTVEFQPTSSGITVTAMLTH
jgi:hypothetical protein